MKLPIHSQTLTVPPFWVRIRNFMPQCVMDVITYYMDSQNIYAGKLASLHLTRPPGNDKIPERHTAVPIGQRTTKTIAQRDNQYCWLASRENWEPMSYIGAVIKEIVWRYHDRIGRRRLKPLNLKSLAPGGFDFSVKLVNFKLISTINILNIFCHIAIRWMPQHLTDH